MFGLTKSKSLSELNEETNNITVRWTVQSMFSRISDLTLWQFAQLRTGFRLFIWAHSQFLLCPSPPPPPHPHPIDIVHLSVHDCSDGVMLSAPGMDPACCLRHAGSSVLEARVSARAVASGHPDVGAGCSPHCCCSWTSAGASPHRHGDADGGWLCCWSQTSQSARTWR